MSLAHGVGNYLHTFEIGISPLLITNGQQLHVEGSGVSHVGTQLSPFSVCASVGKLNEVEAVVDEGLQSFDGGWSMSVITILELAGHAHIQYGQGFGTNLFTQEEEFVEAETIALEIIGIVAIGEGALPAILIYRTILDRTYGVLPVVAVVQCYAFNDATTRETEYSRLHVGKRLSQVLTHAVFVSLPSVNREQADVLYINCTTSTASVLVAHKQSQLGFVDSAIGFQDDGVLLPVARCYLDVLLAELLMLFVGIRLYQLNAQHLGLSFRYTRIDTKAVFLVLFHTNAEVTFVLQTCPPIIVVHGAETCIVRIAVKRTIVLNLNLTKGLPSHQMVGSELKRAILQEFAIKSTIGGKIDILEEDTVHCGLNYSSRLLGVNGHGVILCPSPHAEG